MIIIESKENLYLRILKSLKKEKIELEEKKYIIEGFRLVEEAFKAGCKY